MTSPFAVWRRNLLVWAVPMSVVVLGILGLVVYYSSFDRRVEVLEKRHQTLTDQLASMRQESEQITEFLGRIESQRRQVADLYGDHFQTEGERFTRAITEVKRLAREAGLSPTSFIYPEEAEGGLGLIRRNINFGVEGTYRELRTFINFLELSDQFLTLEGIGLSGSTGGAPNQEPSLNIGLRLVTYFSVGRTETPEPSVAGASGDSGVGGDPEEDPT